jgi:hypothetical protein
LTLEVLDPTLPLTIVTKQLPAAVLGQDYAELIRVAGGEQPYVWRIIEGTLPRGLLLGTDGLVFGQPSMVGIVPFTVEIRDNLSVTATASFIIETHSPGNLTIVSSELAEGTVGEEYEQALISIGGSSMIVWSEVTEAPPGLLVDGTGILRGIPELAGDYRFRVRAVDQVTGIEDTNLLTINVVAEGRFGVATAMLPEGQPGIQYRTVIKGEGGKKPYTWEARRRLIAGQLQRDDFDGRLRRRNARRLGNQRHFPGGS